MPKLRWQLLRTPGSARPSAGKVSRVYRARLKGRRLCSALTIHSSRCRFAARLNSSVRHHWRFHAAFDSCATNRPRRWLRLNRDEELHGQRHTRGHSRKRPAYQCTGHGQWSARLSVQVGRWILHGAADHSDHWQCHLLRQQCLAQCHINYHWRRHLPQRRVCHLLPHGME